MKKLLPSILVTLLLLSGCSANASSATDETTINADYDEEGATTITLSDEISINGNGASLQDDTITISKPGTYIISGSAEARIIIDSEANGDVKLVLRDVILSYLNGPAILVSQASSTYIILDEGSESNITTTGEDEEEGNGAIKTHDDLIVTGSGILNITSEGDGIHANDTLTVQDTTLNITAGDDGLDVNDSITINTSTINITTAEGATETNNQDMMGGEMPQGDMQDFDPSSMDSTQPLSNEDGSLEPSNNENMPEAPNGEMPSDGNMTPPDMNTNTSTDSYSTTIEETKAKGIKCDGNIVVSDSTITVNSADDAIHTNTDFTTSNSTYTLSASDDGIHADGTLTIESGTIEIAMCYEGLEAKYIVINDGEINIVASDDAINSADSEFTGNTMMEADESKLTINGGIITIDARGDGIDMNGTGEMNGGTLTIYGPTSSADGAIDAQGGFTVNGGTLLAGGPSGMAESPSESSTQNCILIDASGTTEIKDSEGNTLVTYTSSKSYDNLVYSSDLLITGETYTIYIDGVETSTITIESAVTDTSSASNMNMSGMDMPNMNLNNDGNPA